MRTARDHILARTEVVEHVCLRNHGRSLLTPNGDAEIATSDSGSAPQEVLKRKLAKFLDRDRRIEHGTKTLFQKSSQCLVRCCKWNTVETVHRKAAWRSKLKTTDLNMFANMVIVAAHVVLPVVDLLHKRRALQPRQLLRAPENGKVIEVGR